MIKLHWNQNVFYCVFLLINVLMVFAGSCCIKSCDKNMQVRKSNASCVSANQKHAFQDLCLITT